MENAYIILLCITCGLIPLMVLVLLNSIRVEKEVRKSLKVLEETNRISELWMSEGNRKMLTLQDKFNGLNMRIK